MKINYNNKNKMFSDVYVANYIICYYIGTTLMVPPRKVVLSLLDIQILHENLFVDYILY